MMKREDNLTRNVQDINENNSIFHALKLPVRITNLKGIT